MLGHLFVYRLKCLLRDRETVFWTLLFPLLLATFFHFAFSRLMTPGEGFAPVKAAVVDSAAYRKDGDFQQALASLSEAGEHQLLELTVAGEGEAERLLAEGVVFGVITAGKPVSLAVRKMGLEESILKVILDEYAHSTKTAREIISKNPGAAGELLAELGEHRSYSEEISFSGAVPDTYLGFFYALIAMACLFSAFWGLRNTVDLQADLSARGARRSAAPTHKLRVVLSDTLAALLISFGELLLLLAYMALVLRIGFGNQLGLVILAGLAGCLAGVSLGNFVGTFLRGSEGLKTGVLIGVSMLMSFLAGLMWVEIKYIISCKAPLFSYINPAALIADAFYSLYLFNTHHRFFLNIGLLILISAAMCTASFIRLRREKYASI
ncbi:MAG: ABC transporter permease [Dethiobacteria bacterium]